MSKRSNYEEIINCVLPNEISAKITSLRHNFYYFFFISKYNIIFVINILLFYSTIVGGKSTKIYLQSAVGSYYKT